MRSMMKVLAAGFLLGGCALAHTSALADVTVADTMTDSATNPAGTWKLYKGDFKAGDKISLAWRGYGNLRMRLHDRKTGKQIMDGSTPVAVTYVGAFSWNQAATMDLTIPVDAPDAVLVIKNPEQNGGQISFQASSGATLQPMTPPSVWVQPPDFWPGWGGERNGSAWIANIGDVPLTFSTDIYLLTPDHSAMWLFWGDWIANREVAPGAWTNEVFHIGMQQPFVQLRMKCTAYGETYTVPFNFLVY